MQKFSNFQIFPDPSSDVHNIHVACAHLPQMCLEVGQLLIIANNHVSLMKAYFHILFLGQIRGVP